MEDRYLFCCGVSGEKTPPLKGLISQQTLQSSAIISIISKSLNFSYKSFNCSSRRIIFLRGLIVKKCIALIILYIWVRKVDSDWSILKVEQGSTCAVVSRVQSISSHASTPHKQEQQQQERTKEEAIDAIVPFSVPDLRETWSTRHTLLPSLPPHPTSTSSQPMLPDGRGVRQKVRNRVYWCWSSVFIIALLF
jgi:hypothetical protein